MWAGRDEPSVPGAEGRLPPGRPCRGAGAPSGPRAGRSPGERLGPCGAGPGMNPSRSAPAFAPAATAPRVLPGRPCPGVSRRVGTPRSVSLTHPPHARACGGARKVSRTQLKLRQICEIAGLGRIRVRGGCEGQQARPRLRCRQGAAEPGIGPCCAPAWGPPAGRCRHLEGAGGAVAVLPSATVGAEAGKKPHSFRNNNIFQSKTFSHNTRAAGNSSASDPTRVFKALLCSEAHQVTADLLCGIISL